MFTCEGNLSHKYYTNETAIINYFVKLANMKLFVFEQRGVETLEDYSSLWKKKYKKDLYSDF